MYTHRESCDSRVRRVEYVRQSRGKVGRRIHPQDHEGGSRHSHELKTNLTERHVTDLLSTLENMLVVFMSVDIGMCTRTLLIVGRQESCKVLVSRAA